MDNSAEPNRSNGLPASATVPFFRRYFAQRVVLPTELPSIMRRHIYTGAMGNVCGFLLYSVFFVYFGNAIGMTANNWGVMWGLTSFLLTGELVAARLTRQVGRRKILWFWFALASRSIRLIGILLAYWCWVKGYPHAVGILLGAVCLGTFMGAMANPPWWSWLADIIPSAKHGRFMARRTWWVNVSVIFAVIPAAWLMDTLPAEYKIQAALMVFFAGTVIGLLDLVIHGTLPEPAMVVPEEKEHFLKQFMEPIRDKGYRRWLTFIVLWNFGMSFGGMFCMVYFLGDDSDMGLKDNMIVATVIFIVFNQLGVLIGSRKWGLYVDKYGVKPVLFWGHIGWAMLPFCWFFATRETVLYWVGFASFIGGSASNAASIAATKYITRYPPPGHQVATYSAVSNFVSNWASGLACLAAGFVVKLIGPGYWDVGAFSFCAFHVLFAASFIMRLSFALFFIPRIKVPDHLAEQQAIEGEAEERRGDWTSMLRP